MRSRVRSCAKAIAALLLVGAIGCQTHRQVVARSEPAARARRVPPGHARRAVTADRAVIVTREVLTEHGYEVVRTEGADGARIVYYRAGNQGRGKGRGPVKRIVIRPTSERVVFEAAPPRVQADIDARLGL
jgi:hypothetical protein